MGRRRGKTAIVEGETYFSNLKDRLYNKNKPLSNVTSFELNDGSECFTVLSEDEGLKTENDDSLKCQFPHSLTVRIWPFQGRGRGSIPRVGRWLTTVWAFR